MSVGTSRAAADEPDRPPVGAPAHTAAGPALAVNGLGKRFGERVAFRDVSFEVARGEIFGFLGPNGAGKTTTVRTLGTLIAPSTGTATVLGVPLSAANGERIRAQIAIMPESPGLYPRLTVTENLECFAGLHELDHVRERIERALASVRLGDRATDRCGALSKGLRQRVALARALLSDPELLFLDEPTSGLDPVASQEVYTLIAALRERGATIFLTTHRLEEAERLCDRVAILNTTLLTTGTPTGLRDRLFASTVRAQTREPLERPDVVLTDLPGVTSWREQQPGSYLLTVSDATVATPALARALVAAGADVLSIGQAQHSLQDVYLRLLADTDQGPPQ